MSYQVAQRGSDRVGIRRVRAIAAALIASVLLALVGSALTASPAAAHATVSRAEPADQSHLMTPPEAVTIQFSEAVSESVGGMTVIGTDRREVQTSVEQPKPDTLRAVLKPGLPDGTYVATYRIISEDGHPISGSLVFAVGNAQIGDVSALTVETDATMDALSKAGQFLVYLGALSAAGLVFFLAALYEPCPSAVRERERTTMARLARIGVAVAVVGMAVVLVAQTAQATGKGMGSVLDMDNLSGVLGQGLGAQDAGVLVGLGLCLVSLALDRGTAAKILAVVGGLLATMSFVLWGHAIEGTDTWLTIPADAIHVVVAAVWFGGLVGLFIVLRSRSAGELVAAGPTAATATAPEARTGATEPAADGAATEASLTGPSTVTAVLDDPDPVDGGASVLVTGRDDRGSTGGPGSGSGGDAGDSDLPATVLCVRRFSAAAFVSLLVLSAAGIAVGLVEMGGLGTLFSSAYGRLLLAKLAVVGVVAAAAGYNRFYLLPWLLADSPEQATVDPERQRAGWRTLLSTVRFEALAIVVVLVLTAVLVNTTPGGSAKAVPSGPFNQSQPMDGGGQVTLQIDPNRPGTNSVMVMVTGSDGKPKDVMEASVEFTLPSAGVGPITRKVPASGPGHFMLPETRDLSIAGDWEVDVVVRLDEFDEARVTFKDTVS